MIGVITLKKDYAMGYQKLITKEQLGYKILNNENISDMFGGCFSLEYIPENFPSYDWPNTGSKILKENYPEFFI